MSQTSDKAKVVGCGAMLVLWMIIASLPAIPFWCFGHGILGGLAFIFIGLPLGLICLVILIAMLGSKDDDDDKGDDEPVEPPSTPVNRIKDFDPSVN